MQCSAADESDCNSSHVLSARLKALQLNLQPQINSMRCLYLYVLNVLSQRTSPEAPQVSLHAVEVKDAQRVVQAAADQPVAAVLNVYTADSTVVALQRHLCGSSGSSSSGGSTGNAVGKRPQRNEPNKIACASARHNAGAQIAQNECNATTHLPFHTFAVRQ
jgi:hypothetical protein